MRVAMWVVAIFGIVIIFGGIIGYVQAQSLVSLVVGSAFGVALLASALAILKGLNRAHYLALLLTIVLTLFFHWRYVHTEALWPAGILAILSAITTVSLLILRPRPTSSSR